MADPYAENPTRRCDCFGDSGLHASTFGQIIGGKMVDCCDLCGWPIREGTVDVLTAVNSAPFPDDAHG